MSASGIPKADLTPTLPGQPRTTTGKGQAAPDGAYAALTRRLADMQTQTLGTLTGSGPGAAKSTAPGSPGALLAAQNNSTLALAALRNSAPTTRLSPTGRNTALFDPESAYRMMSIINERHVAYKAQLSALGQMQSDISALQQDAKGLNSIVQTTDNAGIKSQLQAFADKYNAWIQHFDADVQNDGVLAGTQAAQIARNALQQSVENVFNGARDGLHGLRDIGFSIDPVSKLASLNTATLDAVLARNKQGVVNSVQEFSANFAKSAQLLNADGNFIPGRLSNLSRVIHYIDEHKSALQAEFGLGDTPTSAGKTKQALTAYSQAFGV